MHHAVVTRGHGRYDNNGFEFIRSVCLENECDRASLAEMMPKNAK
jgi:hypothetical protein